MGVATVSALDALRTSLKKVFDDTYPKMREESFYKRVCFEASSTSKSNTYGWLGAFPEMHEWIGERVVRNLKEHGYVINNKLWESTVTIPRADIEDDNLGMYTGIVQGIAEAAAFHPDRLVGKLLPDGRSTLCYDGQNFFDTDHPVYENHDGTGTVSTVSNFVDGAEEAWYLLDTRRTFKPFIFQKRQEVQFDALTDSKKTDSVFMTDKFIYGTRARHSVGYGFWQMAYMSRQPLTADNFRAARAAMRAFKGDGGQPLGIRPSTIVIPGALQSKAEKIFLKSSLENGSSNELYKAVEIIDTDWLEAA